MPFSRKQRSGSAAPPKLQTLACLTLWFSLSLSKMQDVRQKKVLNGRHYDLFPWIL